MKSQIIESKNTLGMISITNSDLYNMNNNELKKKKVFIPDNPVNIQLENNDNISTLINFEPISIPTGDENSLQIDEESLTEIKVPSNISNTPLIYLGDPTLSMVNEFIVSEEKQKNNKKHFLKKIFSQLTCGLC